MNVIEEINNLLDQYPDRRAALLPALYIAQKQGGWLSQEMLEVVSDTLNVPEATVKGVASFYSMFKQRPMGRHLIQICTNVACMIMGAEKLVDFLKDTYGLEPGGTTEDGRFSLVIMECIGACDRAPAMLVDTDFYSDLSGERVASVLEGYE
jgi:NADH-quinone oxidoreductase E subunit